VISVDPRAYLLNELVYSLSSESIEVKFTGDTLVYTPSHSFLQNGYYVNIILKNGIRIVYKFDKENDTLNPYYYSYGDVMCFADEDAKNEYTYIPSEEDTRLEAQEENTEDIVEVADTTNTPSVWSRFTGLFSSSSEGDSVVEIEVKQTENIIKQQNTLLAGEATGKQLVAQFQAYLKAAYPTYSGKLSEIFTGIKACYNADDLVALMRVVRANPATATGVASCEEVVTLFPRGAAANRMENIQDFAEIWGVNGLDSESNNLFFDGAGKLNVIGGTKQNYDALVLLNQLYNEGLIQKNFYEKGDSNAYLNRYFKNSDKENSGAGFMLYDYCASTTVGNAVDANGIGTKKESRNGVYAGIDRTGIRPVLAPVTYWNTSYELKNTDALFDANGQVYNRDQKTLTRFSDSNRALKGNSWCIPSNSTNIPGAVTLMDYLYSEEGSYINDFGPQPYRGEMSSDIIFGQSVPTLGAKLIDMYLKSGTDFWSFMREYIGSTNGIGSVRSDALDMQVTNQYAAVGLKNVQKAIKLGAMTLAKCKTAENYGWDACVPTNWQVSENATAKKNYEKVTNFWAAG
jgi:putative aldouronate transport system substrate-binding protein